MTHNREAERLRIILETFRYAHPAMTLDEAVPMIWEAERRTAELESQQHAALRKNADGTFTLADNAAETIAAWIDTQADIVAMLPHDKIHAIKETRSRLMDAERAGMRLGLMESKRGVESWLAAKF